MRATLLLSVLASISTLIAVTHAAKFHDSAPHIAPRRLAHTKHAHVKKRSWDDLDSYGTSSSSCPVTGKVNQKALLNMHNTMRATTGARPLVWGNDLAAVAQCHANKCRFEHSHTKGMGENIACGNSNQYQPETGVNEWWNEWKLWRKGMGFAHSTGHFTQMAWKDTRRVGCGVATCSSANLGLGSSNYYPKGAFLVCEYDPPGNVIGRFDGEVNLPSRSSNKDSYGTDDLDSYGTNNLDSYGTDSDSTKSSNKDAYGWNWIWNFPSAHKSHHGHQPSINNDVTKQKPPKWFNAPKTHAPQKIPKSKKPHTSNSKNIPSWAQSWFK